MSSRSLASVVAGPVWLATTLILGGVAGAELNRVAGGDLFLFKTSFDDDASISELQDARASAERWQIPAVFAVFCCGGLSYFLMRGVAYQRPNRWLVALFLLSTALDMFTTLRFFHDIGIDVEVHPGVRLLGYAYGRTAGPVLAKTFQALGILFLAARLSNLSRPLLLGTSVVYTLAAAYNLFG